MKFLRLSLLISIIFCTTFNVSAKTIDIYDCKYSTPPLVLIQLKNGKESCKTRTCISEVRCKSNTSEIKIRSVCPATVGKDLKWHCPEAEDCVFDQSIKVSVGNISNGSSIESQDKNSLNISK